MSGIDIILNNMHFFLLGMFPNGPLGGLALTIHLSVTIGAASLCFGIFLAAVRIYAPYPMQLVTIAVSTLIRGVPALAFLFWMYFLIPRLTGFNLSPFASATIALSLYHGAYMGEDIRGGIQAVAKGQWEAARSSSLGFFTTLRHIILPQAIRAVTPVLINRFVNLFMYTSVVSILGILEFTRSAVLVNNREIIYSTQIFAFVGVTYFIFCYAISRFGAYLERRWSWAPKIRTIQSAV